MRHQHACVLHERRALRAVTPAAPVDAGGYTVDLDAPRKLAHQLRPRLITIGMSLKLFAHPVREIRAIAGGVFPDALVARRAGWSSPMTMRGPRRWRPRSRIGGGASTGCTSSTSKGMACPKTGQAALPCRGGRFCRCVTIETRTLGPRFPVPPPFRRRRMKDDPMLPLRLRAEHRDGPRDGPQSGMGLLTRHPGQFRLRGLNRPDAPLLAAHLLRLPPEDRRARFHGGMSDAAVTAYVNRIDWHHAYVFGVFIDGDLRGVAELVPMGDGAGEIAVSVEERFRHDGLGRLLVVATMLAARRLGMAEVMLDYLPRNLPMAALMRELGAKTQFRGLAVEAVIGLKRQPRPQSAVLS
jgi:GNAT superfamily N-acetyltransferase